MLNLLLEDLATLAQLGEFVRDTVLFVVADSLAARWSEFKS